jgi:hypothetical protein
MCTHALELRPLKNDTMHALASADTVLSVRRGRTTEKSRTVLAQISVSRVALCDSSCACRIVLRVETVDQDDALLAVSVSCIVA